MPDLNRAQQQAVEAGDGPQLILAGAGTGKTRTIVHRIGHLIASRGIAPHRILAVTFTNKAATEMKSRLGELIGEDGGGVTSGTFHAISLRLLRSYADALAYPRSFQVVDADDQKALIRKLLKERNIASDRLHPSYLLNWIEHCKHAGLTPDQVPEHSWNGIDMCHLYGEYQQQLKQYERMDFSDLILNVVLLLRHHGDIAAAIRARFDHVLVDEYQDTNPVQHEWLTLLCKEHRNVTVVGDDDQSIYGWRGADVQHILEFERLWHGATVHRLEENYRSTESILNLANAIIRDNTGRHEKTLRPTREKGSTPLWKVCNDEYDEARQILEYIEHWRAQGRPWREIALLYRSNRQSLPLEQVFRESRIPYRIIGGVGFFERMEIRDALAYWALLNRCGDSLQLIRICNRPKRGLGTKGQQQLAMQLTASGLRAPEWLDFIAHGHAEGAAKKLQPLARLIMDIRNRADSQPDRGLNELLEASGYLESLKAMGEIEAASRLENIRTLQHYIELCMAENLTPIEFMDRAALLQSHEEISADNNQNGDDDAIAMMSLHRAKGLEFDCVVLPGIEEGLLPHQRAMDEGGAGISEERRLLYVGVTRAREQLLLTSARLRRFFGDTHYPLPSRFIKTLPQDVLLHDTPMPAVNSTENAAGISIGGNVAHPTFGEGVVLELDGAGDASRVTVQFRNSGIKRLMLKYAALQALNDYG